MKNWINLFIIMIFLVTHVNAIDSMDKIAIVNISDVFQQSSQRAVIVKQLECEFKDRANELEMLEYDLKMKMQTLQKNGAIMKENERDELEQSLITQREIFSNKAKLFQQDNHTRQTEERDKILDIIHNVVKNIAKKENYDIVIDANAIIFSNTNIKDITVPVMKQVG